MAKLLYYNSLIIEDLCITHKCALYMTNYGIPCRQISMIML